MLCWNKQKGEGGRPVDARRYRQRMDWFNARPRAKAALKIAGAGAVAAVYAAYIGALLWLAAARAPRFWAALCVPAAAFLLGTALRAGIDRPRPYTALGTAPLFPKAERGKSMPSRHCFCAAAIAVTLGACAAPPLGAVLGVLAVLIAAARVLAGVHYLSDVLAGLAFGVGIAVLGLWAFSFVAVPL